MPDLSRRADLYGKAVEAAARTLGDRPFQEDVGHFWGLLETRPYMRARLGYAECLWSADRREEALAEMTDLLRLNPSDNLGVRHLLVPRLLELQREDEAARVLAAYEKDGSPFMAYARLLAELRRGGAGEAVERALTAALRSNPHVPKYLLGGGRLPEPAGDSYRPGSDEEAVLAAESLRKPWQETPGAVNWLRESRKRAKKVREQKRGKGRGTRR
jgi:tetratricopeptide (TPR) repeat protein